ncbi:MAG: hypothetical protein MI810_04240 [Flavobacteriales bacterium]|nr:hypothetical protein [Flavobacteriales bacterium]
MDRKKLMVLLLLVVVCKTSPAQNSRVKIGQSFLFNASFWEGKLIPCWGGELAYEFSPVEGISFSLGGMAHYGFFRKEYDDTPVFLEHDFLIGIQPDFRIHLQDMYNGFYLGFGGDMKLLVARNFFPPTPNDPTPTYVGIEMFLGATVGTYYQLSHQASLNPFFYFGIGNQNNNEHELNFRLGMNLALNFHKANEKPTQ